MRSSTSSSLWRPAVGSLTTIVLSAALTGCGGAEPEGTSTPVEEAALAAEEPRRVRMAPPPLIPTEEELEKHLQQRAASGLGPLPVSQERMLGDHATEIDLAPRATPLTLGIEQEATGGLRTFSATPGSLTPCNVDFAQQSGIAAMANQAYNTFAFAPHYRHWCNNNGYLVRTLSISLDHYHLSPEAANCVGSSPKIGTHRVNGVCMNQTEGKFWPRVAGNMGSNTGIEFWVKSAGNVQKNFDFRSFDVISGSAEVWVLKNTGWAMWNNLGPGHWVFPNADNVGYLDLYESGKNGTVFFDNVEVAIIP
jgi:hypothetical protein